MNVKALNLKYNIASMMVYEQVTGKPFQLDGSMTSMVLLIWSIIEANNPGTIALKDMIAWLDDHPDDMRYLVTEVSRLIKISSGLVDADDTDEDKKKASRQV